MQVIETLTVAEATEQLRALGLRVSPTALRDGIEQGTFPFGDYIASRNSGKRYIVYKRLFDEWVNDRAIPG